MVLFGCCRPCGGASAESVDFGEEALTLSKKLFAVALIAALGTLLGSAQFSSATHVRPSGASPLYVPIAIAYKQCTTPNSTHSGALAAPSCTAPLGPRQESQYLQVGTGDANGAAANLVGSIKLVVKATSPEDVLMTLSATDIRCKPATAGTVCNSPNLGTAGPDYSGQLQGLFQMRVTDHWNGASTTDPGTMVDLP